MELHDGERRSIKSQMVRLKVSNRIAFINYKANSLVFLGLVGTVIGFIVALSIGRRPWNNQHCEGRRPIGREPDP
ncbi:MAG: hypothetical protein VX973_00770, partial [Pseudomonadota bacterium]|nr:hypothetical protein [Pseudomonadota bacterium]